MKKKLPDILDFEEKIFNTKDVLQRTLRFSIDLMEAQQITLLFGTNTTHQMFLAPEKWDRGIFHKFDGIGIKGLYLKYFGKIIANFKGLASVKLYKKDEYGKLIYNDGIIAYVLKTFIDFYKKGSRVLIINNIEENMHGEDENDSFSSLPVLSFNGNTFNTLTGLKVNKSITSKLTVSNFIAVYVPDYGALVINTANQELLKSDHNGFVHGAELKKRLNILIQFVEMASIAYLGVAKGQQAAKLIWRKERNLRETASRLEKQKLYLRAVGGVTEKQLNMEPLLVAQGVYAFVDMVGSARIRQKYNPEDYFFITNTCRQIAANIATLYSCRVGNFIGDSLFFQNVSAFDSEEMDYVPGIHERTMLMILVLVSMFRELDQLIRGKHPIDIQSRVCTLVNKSNLGISFRTGIETGIATIGPIGSKKRMIITAIGEAVDNASRLESTGKPNGIHMGKSVMRILQEAEISKDTKLLYDLVTEKYPRMNNMYEKEKQILEETGRISFFDFYKSGFAACDDIIKEDRNVKFKEFSSDITYFLQWDRKRKPQSCVCFGI